MGTVGVREYLRGMKEEPDPGIERPEFSADFPTSGPKNRFDAILYIEKEGFLPLLQQAKFAERFDLVIMSSKGMGTTAVRTLIESVCPQVKILVLHDFDKSGFSIVGTLRRDTRRYEFAVAPQVVDLGLRLSDVEKWELEAEAVSYNSDPGSNLSLNGATQEEIEFLCSESDWRSYCGHRVELNAFTSDAFVVWLESKLKEQGVAKVMPDDTTLEIAYRRAVSVARYREVIDMATEEIQKGAATIQVPRDLRAKLGRRLAKDRVQAWDDALESLVSSD